MGKRVAATRSQVVAADATIIKKEENLVKAKRAEKDAIEKVKETAKKPYATATPEQFLNVVSKRLENIEFDSDLSALKDEFKDKVRVLDLLELRLDQLAVGEYTQRKIQSLLSSGEFCNAAKMAAKADCSKAPFDKSVFSESYKKNFKGGKVPGSHNSN